MSTNHLHIKANQRSDRPYNTRPRGSAQRRSKPNGCRRTLDCPNTSPLHGSERPPTLNHALCQTRAENGNYRSLERDGSWSGLRATTYDVETDFELLPASVIDLPFAGDRDIRT
jgi:hypothetical protein